MQVRNVASLGGHLMWAHPCSDLVPVLATASGCNLNVVTAAGQRLDIPFRYAEGNADDLSIGEILSSG